MEFYSVGNLGPRVQVFFPEGTGRAKQSMRDECDINLIMAKFAKTGYVDHLGRHGEDYGFATSVDFHAAMNIVTKADQMFADLPSAARSRFHGDPAEFLDFVQDDGNHAELVKLGLADPGPAAEPAPVAAGGTPEVIVPVVPVVPAEPVVTPSESV